MHSRPTHPNTQRDKSNSLGVEITEYSSNDVPQVLTEVVSLSELHDVAMRKRLTTTPEPLTPQDSTGDEIHDDYDFIEDVEASTTRNFRSDLHKVNNKVLPVIESFSEVVLQAKPQLSTVTTRDQIDGIIKHTLDTITPVLPPKLTEAVGYVYSWYSFLTKPQTTQSEILNEQYVSRDEQRTPRIEGNEEYKPSRHEALIIDEVVTVSHSEPSLNYLEGKEGPELESVPIVTKKKRTRKITRTQLLAEMLRRYCSQGYKADCDVLRQRAYTIINSDESFKPVHVSQHDELVTLAVALATTPKPHHMLLAPEKEETFAERLARVAYEYATNTTVKDKLKKSYLQEPNVPGSGPHRF